MTRFPKAIIWQLSAYILFSLITMVFIQGDDGSWAWMAVSVFAIPILVLQIVIWLVIRNRRIRRKRKAKLQADQAQKTQNNK